MLRTQFQAGMSLLEMILALLIAGIIIVLGAQYYFSYKKTAAVGLLESGVSQIMDALNDYYYMNCAKNPDKLNKVKIEDLIDENLLPSNIYSYNTYGTYAVKVNHDANYQLQVITLVNDGALANFIRSALNADPAPSGALAVVWTRQPNHSTDDINSHQWIFNGGPGQDFMPGRFMTAVNAGNRSKFWMLNSDVESFAVLMGRQDGCVN
jgi:prepilin-type N-terminal cleavage/methylation domain-containing protein